MNYMKFNRAEQLLEEGEYEIAFKLFEEITEDESSGNELKADAFNMLGVIISGFAPYLDEQDESGLCYFVKAIEVNPLCLGALLNIVFNYTTNKKHLFSMHSDSELFILAYDTLNNKLWESLSISVKKDLKTKKALRLSLL